MSLAPISGTYKKLLRRLTHKKHREKEKLFLVAGRKSVLEVHASAYQIEALFATSELLRNFPEFQSWSVPIYQVSSGELSQLSSLTHHQDILALVAYPSSPSLSSPLAAPHLILDDIQQPHNLGALLRVADWYGISHIVASPQTVDLYNPKVIQASMGSFGRVSVHYRPLVPHCKSASIPLIGATLTGESLHHASLPLPAALVIGNEARGIRQVLYSYLKQEVTIPRRGQAASLNLAVAAGILCEAWFRT